MPLTIDQGTVVQIKTGHQPQIDYMKQCSRTKTFADMAFISSDGETVSAHKLIVASVSEKLGSLLFSEDDPPVFVLPDFDSETIHSLVSIISSGEVVVSDAVRLARVQELAKVFDIKAVLDVRKVNPQNAGLKRKVITEKKSMLKQSKAPKMELLCSTHPSPSFLVKKEVVEDPQNETSPDSLMTVHVDPADVKFPYENPDELRVEDPSEASTEIDNKMMTQSVEADSVEETQTFFTTAKEPKKNKGGAPRGPQERTCQKCAKKFREDQYSSRKSMGNSYLTHIANCKGPKRLFYCGFCDKTGFKKRYHLNKHMESCSKPRTCYDCGKEFRSNYRLINHICKATSTSTSLPYASLSANYSSPESPSA